jgi:RNA 2',3'-cyclic 3'-phosphodiesterase
MNRIFIALKVEPGDALLRIYSSLKSLLGNEKINWVDLCNIHLTLAFLGETHDERIKVAGIMLKNKCSGFGEFSFTLTGTGVFKDYRDPKVIWIGIDQSERLQMLNDVINTGLKDTGFSVENRPFKPHITIGRIKFIKDSENLRSSIERYQHDFVQEVHVSEVILYESILKPTGPVYRPVGKFSLI